eukprot:3904615-Rhodomonas_salina.1
MRFPVVDFAVQGSTGHSVGRRTTQAEDRTTHSNTLYATLCQYRTEPRQMAPYSICYGSTGHRIARA